MADTDYKRLGIGVTLFNDVQSKARPLCSIDGCGKARQARGWCKSHWGKWKRFGDPLHQGKSPLPECCEIDGCERSARSRWKQGNLALCAMHYLRMLNAGSTDNPFNDPTPDGKCSVDGCSALVRGRVAQHCERHYYQIRRNGTVSTRMVDGREVLVMQGENMLCNHCGRPSSGKMYCSGRCATRGGRRLPTQIACKNCSATFEPVNGVVTCSSGCAKEFVRKSNVERYRFRMENDPAFVQKQRAAEYKRKSLKRDAFVEDVDRDKVMARDRWVCHLCMKKIPKSAKWPSGQFGTLDHVIPLNKGGLHSYANVKAAHLSCNCSKNDKVIGQLGLEFAA